MDPGSIALFILAVFTEFACTYEARPSSRPGAPKLGLPPHATADVRAVHAVVFVVAGSIGLLMLFYFLDAMTVLFTVVFFVAGTASVVVCAYPPLCRAVPRLAKEVDVPCFGPAPLACVAILPFALATTSVYMLLRGGPGGWILNDLLAVTLSVQFCALLRVPSLRVAAAFLVCIFFYDLFWVFFSADVFGGNVMVNAAKLELPVKLVVPLFREPAGSYTMLGLGDIVLPGLLLSLCLRFDRQGAPAGAAASKPPGSSPRRYYACGLAGYVAGLAVCYAVLLHSDAPQPAMIYLVPGTLGPVAALAAVRGELGEMWAGEAGREGAVAADGADPGPASGEREALIGPSSSAAGAAAV
eukprot:tig00000025_g7940.t1